jgi:hypothetical protein
MSLANQRSYSFDSTLQLKDAGLVAASAAAQVASSNQIINLGGAVPFLGVVVIDVTALEVDTGDEIYTIILEGSNSSSFASGNVALAAMPMGHATALAAGLASAGTGRFELPFINVQADTAYQYLRLYTKIAGTIATGINYKAYIGRLPPDGV